MSKSQGRLLPPPASVCACAGGAVGLTPAYPASAYRDEMAPFTPGREKHSVNCCDSMSAAGRGSGGRPCLLLETVKMRSNTTIHG